MENDSNKKEKNKSFFLLIIFLTLTIVVMLAVTYAYFNYTRTGDANVISTGNINFEFENTSLVELGNAFPISQSEVDNKYDVTFTIKADSDITKGLTYRVYAIEGDTVAGKSRLSDNVISMLFEPAPDADGFTTVTNNYNTAKSPVFNNGEALISTGLIKNTDESVAAKTYKLTLWIDSSKILISSTTKRANNAEGNPSLADTTLGTATANRYIKNDSNLVSTTLYPASSEYAGKMVYTTNEFSNSYYSIKIAVEAVDEKNN